MSYRTLLALTKMKMNKPHDNPNDDPAQELTDLKPPALISQRPIVYGAEGSVLRHSIQIGPNYQASVPSFSSEPSSHPTYSSNREGPAKVVWKPGHISDDDFNQFVHRLASLHTPYLRNNRYTSIEPYTALSCDQYEMEWAKRTEVDLDAYSTSSTFSTASALATDQRASLLKECDVDAVLELIHDHQYDTNRAWQTIQSNVASISTPIWTIHDKNFYRTEVHHCTGDINGVATKLVRKKSFRDVIDFHYRFYIPDNFRIVRCRILERTMNTLRTLHHARRRQNGGIHLNNLNSGIDISAASSSSSSHLAQAVADAARNQYERSHDRSLTTSLSSTKIQGNTVLSESIISTRKRKHWSETSVSEVAVAVDYRLIKSRSLLWDIYSQIGAIKATEVAIQIKKCSEQYALPGSHEDLLMLLDGHPELQQRLQELIPRTMQPS
jgi:hypothetical protein